MFNIGGGELLVIAMLALIVLGPDKLPQAARQVGRFMSEARKVSAGFRQEMKNALEEAEASSASATAAAATAPVGSDDDLIEARARERGRQLAAAPEGAEPIGDQPVKAEPVEPPAATNAPAADTKAPGTNGQHGRNGNGSTPRPAAGDSTTDAPDPS